MEHTVAEIFKKHKVALGYLFGSYVSGKPGVVSDIDVAVFLADMASPAEEAKRLGDIQFEIGRATGRERVDMVNLRTVESPVLRYAILLEGKPLVVSDIRLKHYLERKALQEFEETQVLRAVQRKILKAKAEQYVAL